MDLFLTILQFVLAFGLLVFVHELGHFLVSKALGIEVEEFGFGYPPRLVKLFTWKGTDVTLNWIPFGGFVRPKGETEEGVEGGMLSAPAWKRLLILLAGATFNFITGIIILIIMFNAVGTADTSRVLVSEVIQGSPAQQADLRAGDLITSIAGTPITSMETLQNLIKANLGKEISIGISRDGQTLTTTATPRVNPPAGQGALGISLTNPLEPLPFFPSVGRAFETFGMQVQQTLMLPVNLVRGVINPSDARVVGIKGIFDIFSNASQMDQTSTIATATPLPIYRLSVISMLSIALGITNLLPIPALDGGQIVLLLPELFFKKRIPQNIVNAINSVFFFLLIALMIYITVQDFVNPVLQP